MSTYHALLKLLETGGLAASLAREAGTAREIAPDTAREIARQQGSGKRAAETQGPTIPVGVSNRHIHLSQTDVAALFGEEHQLTPTKPLSQPGQYACKETLTICGPKGAIERVRVLGPVRGKTQVEVLAGDAYKLGVIAPTRMSGDLTGTPGITLIGPKGSVQAKEGLVVAQRHIHMTLADARNLAVRDGQIVSIQLDGPRGGVYHNVVVRANKDSALEFHVDIEEANAMNINSNSRINIVTS